MSNKSQNSACLCVCVCERHPKEMLFTYDLIVSKNARRGAERRLLILLFRIFLFFLFPVLNVCNLFVNATDKFVRCITMQCIYLK